MKKNVQQEDIGNKKLELEGMLNNKDDCTFKTSDIYGNHEKYNQQRKDQLMINNDIKLIVSKIL